MINAIGPSIAIESNNLNPSNSVNILSFAIFAIFNLKRQLKLLEMDCDQFLTCLIFPLRWVSFPFKISDKTKWEHLFSMYFNDYLSLKSLSDDKMISQWEHYTPAIISHKET